MVIFPSRETAQRVIYTDDAAETMSAAAIVFEAPSFESKNKWMPVAKLRRIHGGGGPERGRKTNLCCVLEMGPAVVTAAVSRLIWTTNV